MKKIIPVLIAVMMLLSCLFVACNEKPYIADNTEHYDEITKKLAFNQTYSGKDVLTDGVGDVTLLSIADGDTIRVKINATGATETIRFYSINTPESTGGVEKWGKAASNFTKEQLGKHTELVIQAIMVNGKPDRDTAGNRLLGYVWYKTATDDFKLLNLELVENGFSDNKCSVDDAYYKYFKEANDFARKIKLRLYSSKEDPLFTSDITQTTIKYWNEHPDEFAENQKICFTGYLTKLSGGGSGTYLFQATEYDEETGKTYSINVYTGYSGASGSKMVLGDLYYISGTLQNYYGTWQVSGVEFSDDYPDETKSSTEQRGYYLTFDSSVTYSDNRLRNFYSDLTVTTVKYDSATKTLTFTGKANQLKSKGFTGDEQTFTFTVTAESESISVGDTLKLTGLQFVKDSGNITILNYSDITKK